MSHESWPPTETPLLWESELLQTTRIPSIFTCRRQKDGRLGHVSRAKQLLCIVVQGVMEQAKAPMPHYHVASFRLIAPPHAHIAGFNSVIHTPPLLPL